MAFLVFHEALARMLGEPAADGAGVRPGAAPPDLVDRAAVAGRGGVAGVPAGGGGRGPGVRPGADGGAPGSMQPWVEPGGQFWWRHHSDLGTGPAAALAVLLSVLVGLLALPALAGLRRQVTWPEQRAVPHGRRSRRRLLMGPLAALWLLPFVVLVLTSLRAPEAAAVSGWWHIQADLRSYGDALADSGFTGALLTTLVRTVVVVALVLLAAVPAAYVLAQEHLVPRRAWRPVLLVAVALAALPPQAFAVPLQESLSRLVGSTLALVTVHAALVIPLAVLVLHRGFARVRAPVMARHRWALVHAVREGSPSVVLAGVLAFVLVWNDTLVGLLLNWLSGRPSAADPAGAESPLHEHGRDAGGPVGDRDRRAGGPGDRHQAPVVPRADGRGARMTGMSRKERLRFWLDRTSRQARAHLPELGLSGLVTAGELVLLLQDELRGKAIDAVVAVLPAPLLIPLAIVAPVVAGLGTHLTRRLRARETPPPLPVGGQMSFPDRVEPLLGRGDKVREVVDRSHDSGVVVVQGGTGTGTSTLAVHAAWELAPEESQQRYVDVRGPDRDRPETELSVAQRVLRALGSQPGLIQEPHDAAPLIKEALSGRDRVLLLDNVSTWSQVAWLPPRVPDAHIVIAGELAGELPQHIKPVQVGPLSAEDGEALLAAQVRDDRVTGDPLALRSLVEACVRSPAEIVKLGRWLERNPGVTLAALVDDLS
ncbi:hypothetical protein ACFSTC_25335 [Nonomuraea ferruginea]